MTDFDGIQSTAQRYCEALHRVDVKELEAVFLSDSQVCSVDENSKLINWPRSAFIDRVIKRGPQNGEVDWSLISIGRTGDVAFVCLEVTVGLRRFSDQLNLLKTTDGWCIIAKTFTVIDGPAIEVDEKVQAT